MSKPQRFCMVEDDDGHYYVCPASKRTAAERYFHKLASLKDTRREPDEPVWLQRIDGPHTLTFTEPKED